MWRQKVLSIVVLLATTAAASQLLQAQEMMELPVEVRKWFRNPDGSCVQCSIGMCGTWNNVPAATTLLWDTEYGKAVRGGSWPSRVADYCSQRGIRAFNVTGDSTFEWMEWAAKTGRFAAIGAGTRHFQTEYGRDRAAGLWYVCNNNSPHRIDEYTNEGYRHLHLASGKWVVILDGPAPPPPPRYVRWW
ncbi:MAG: hypothetical protein KDB14_34745 [Planctomycetales bacterium]|nr:hypothetical protein [Planctomycetales bacterium]